MKSVFQSALVGVICAAVLTAWISVGYLIQRFILRNPNPWSSAILTSMVVTIAAVAAAGIVLGYWP